jgi:hypothetical protein
MPYRMCPRFQSCSCNDCPLDPSSAVRGGRRVAVPGEEECRASRETRALVAVAAGIDPALVLLPRERRRVEARAKWESLPVDVRERAVASGAGTRFRRIGRAEWPVSSVDGNAGGGPSSPSS